MVSQTNFVRKNKIFSSILLLFRDSLNNSQKIKGNLNLNFRTFLYNKMFKIEVHNNIYRIYFLYLRHYSDIRLLNQLSVELTKIP